MSVNAIMPTSTAAATQNAATKQLSGNFNTFLTLLTTQLKNQDPMSPMDSSQFTQQLVQFSQVEQSINTNDNLKTLISLTQGRSASDAVSYLGKTATITTGDAPLSNGNADWSYALGGASTGTAPPASMILRGTAKTATATSFPTASITSPSRDRLPMVPRCKPLSPAAALSAKLISPAANRC
jgi:hypothetical protein